MGSLIGLCLSTVVPDIKACAISGIRLDLVNQAVNIYNLTQNLAETFGIFDGKLNGDVFTYYYFCGDTVRYWGTDNWWKGTDFRRVDYNFMTDEAVVTPIKKRTKQIVEMASENNYRTL